MSSEPVAFATIDRGTASVAVSLVGRVDRRWRLLGATAGPASVGAEPLLERLRTRLTTADRALAAACRLTGPGRDAELARLEVHTVAPPVMVVVGATERVVAPFAAVAVTAGWRVRPLALADADILAVASALADPSVTAVLAGASDPPGADERPLIADLEALVAAATQRRPDLVMILGGGLAVPGGRGEAAIAPDRPGQTLLAPTPTAADGARLRQLLDDVRGGADDARRMLVRSVTTLAEVLQRRVEVVEIGQSAGARVSAGWSPDGIAPLAGSAIVADAALMPRDVDDATVDAVVGWLGISLDRLRLRDRLHELLLTPWGDAAGDGAQLRIAAARAALARLVAATPALDRMPAPDLTIAVGGVWTLAPGPAVALALADVLRRPGVRALGLDHARLLGPLGAIEDAAERRQVISDLRDELIVPLGSVVMAGSLHGSRPVGRLRVDGAGQPVELDLVPGSLALVDLPPGERALLEASFREPVDMGIRARHFAAEVSGGLGGLLVDMRDIPLSLPERQDRRREVMAAWQAALWAGMEA